ncbi:hypothetical protein BCIN_06g01650 [Botrytis cinerea B05.10]|uniref:Uncharacterized protein n=1 Tax=Botryotinia fuckeliana (strain B05.10) TaxID=332648 RepID=A0A384JJM4_BOTFB|nr:hypothetical protein BCIN_06g01650 [Botrytis cinerea B05.10]ATZ50672.1 hypothetical protein BCIN_06g01650 [Botrytis cinerea B05.10]
MALKPDFLDEDAVILELIPGFPSQEFDGTSAFQNNADILDILHHNVSKRFLDFIKRTSPEIRTNILAQIPTRRVAEHNDLNSDGHFKKSPHRMQDYSTLYGNLQFSPIKYSIQVTSKGSFNEGKRLKTRDAQRRQEKKQWASFMSRTTIQLALPGLMSSRGANLHAVYWERLRQLLMTQCLCYETTDDVPDHLGIREMFAMEE